MELERDVEDIVVAMGDIIGENDAGELCVLAEKGEKGVIFDLSEGDEAPYRVMWRGGGSCWVKEEWINSSYETKFDARAP